MTRPLVMPVVTINHVRTTLRTLTRGQALGIVYQLRHAHPTWLVTLEVV